MKLKLPTNYPIPYNSFRQFFFSFFFFQSKNNASGPADTFDKEMVKRLNKNHYLANPNETSVNSHGSIEHSLMNTDYHRSSNHRGYSTDGKLSVFKFLENFIYRPNLHRRNENED